MMDEIDHQMLLDQLIRMEGLTLRPRRDTEGLLYIGVGRNLDRIGVTRGEAVALLENDVRRVTRELEEQLPFFGALDIVRQRVLIHLALNIGITGVLVLRRFVAAIESGSWGVAADEMSALLWAKQNTRRAEALAEMMRTGRDDLWAS